MGLDIKIPIGLMFSILGIILTILGIVTSGNAEMYEQSLGHNINLWSGAAMLVFGAFMLLTSTLVKKKQPEELKREPKNEE
ncbi:MAG: hypothetical protein KAT15_09955 [Bacteroidales bacterium]|nr:hypothetical protein [Bacteroidales bacterium]